MFLKVVFFVKNRQGKKKKKKKKKLTITKSQQLFS